VQTSRFAYTVVEAVRTYPRSVTRRLLVSLLFMAVVMSVPMLAAESTASPVAPICGNLSKARPPQVMPHVVWIFMENKSEGAVVGSPRAPFIQSLVSACGLATNYHNITHPSLPNYLAATSGSTHGIASDCRPATCAQSGPSIFGQLQAAHRTWRSYVESMPVNCDRSNAGTYATKHNPAVYYNALGAGCKASDVPLDTGLARDLARGRLPSLSVIVPNTCDDMHSCPISIGDAWLQSWVGRIVSTPAYADGHVVVFITWDEGEVRGVIPGENCAQNPGDESCHVAMLVLSAYTAPGTADARAYTHYSLLLTTEQLLGLRGRLGKAAEPGTLSLRSGFGL
jgi:phosphatidylinositol-3-phosphatase